MDGIMNIENKDVIKSVRDHALLANMSIGMWGANRTDKKLLDEVKQHHGATGDVGKLIKNILAGADERLKDVHSAYTAARSKHYEFTLPWVADPHAKRNEGPRLLPHRLFQDYAVAISKIRKDAEEKLRIFLEEYPQLVQQAKANLAGMADAEYPTVEEIKSAFRMHVDFEPVPESAQFRGLPDGVVGSLTTMLNKRQQNQIDTAVGAMWQQTRSALGHLVEKLKLPADPEEKKSRLYTSTLENVRELVTLLPAWGSIVGSEQAEEIAKDIKTLTDGLKIDDLKKDDGVRNTTAAQAQKVVNKMASWGL
jgi:hypothetical protein